ncbi:MAG: hypothetical protein JO317_03890 [Verrucomicrobiae bacterium]|nr:hypothetical protein [Verrucomicrobiae bacterium]
MRKRWNPGHGEPAFTLFEMLTVLLILTVLIALIFPSLQRARESARQSKCLGNLRSWSVAFKLYASDNNGYYPFSWANNSDNWVSWIAAYVNSDWLSYDPGTFAKRLDPTKCGCPTYLFFKHPDPNFRAFPYSYNAVRFDYPFVTHVMRGNPLKLPITAPSWARHEDPWHPGNPGWVPGDPSGDWDPSGVAGRYGGVAAVSRYVNTPPEILYTKPAQCEVLFCGVGAHWRTSGFVAPVLPDPSDDDWDIRTGNLTASSPEFSQPARGVHNGRDNMLFMDGHAQSISVNDANLNYYVYNHVPSGDPAMPASFKE